MPDVRLDAAGRLQAGALAERLRRDPLDAVYTSPLERALETAACLTPAPRLSEAVIEIDYGAWTGNSFASLDNDPQWQRWNAERGQARPPCGESMIEAQRRAVQEIRALCRRHDGGRIAIVSHCDIIKSVLMAWLGMPLDAWSRFEISPASISVLVAWADGGKVLSMNEAVPA